MPSTYLYPLVHLHQSPLGWGIILAPYLAFQAILPTVWYLPHSLPGEGIGGEEYLLGIPLEGDQIVFHAIDLSLHSRSFGKTACWKRGQVHSLSLHKIL